MRKLDITELGRINLEEYHQMDKLPIVVVLDNLRSARNVGSIFRSADCFGIDSVVLCGVTPQPPHKEISKTAIGATHSVKWFHFATSVEAILELRKQGYNIIGIEQTTKSVGLRSFEPAEKVAIVMGNEVNGVSDDALPLLDHSIELEQFGTKHSFNVSVCAGIVMYDLSGKMRNNRL